MTQLRELAEQYSKGTLDMQSYRAARNDFITRVMDGAYPLEINEYLAPLSVDDTEAKEFGIMQKYPCPEIFILDDDVALFPFTLQATLLAIGALALLIGTAVWLF